MFAGLERCDLSRWPKGFFRRSFFRDYVQMLSLPVSEACAQFARLFPDQEEVTPPHLHRGGAEPCVSCCRHVAADCGWGDTGVRANRREHG